MQYKPAIVVAAYNRPHTLLRLLNALSHAYYIHTDIPLVLSIDKSNNPEVANLCHAYVWQHGPKHIIEHTEKLGLKQHIIACCNLSQQYGSIIMLEDDLMVSAHFYNYALQALNHYGSDEQLAGISLYSYAVTENKFLPFYPVADNFDNYFLQLPSSWGQVYTAQQWQQFKSWYKNNKISNEQVLPQYVIKWGEKSWKKHFVQYMIEHNKYFVFPKTSYSTNCGEPGVNTDRQGLHQVQLAQNLKQHNFSNLQQSVAVYDAWYEVLPEKLNLIAPWLSEYNYTTDLYGTKQLSAINTAYILSSKPCTNPTLLYGNVMVEAIQNISMGVEGSFYALAPTNQFTESDIDTQSFYINTSSIKDIVFNNYLQYKLEDLKNEIAYKTTHPKIVLVQLSKGENESIKDLLYPTNRVTTKHVAIRQLSIATNNDEYAYYLLIENNAPIDRNIAAEAISIMQKYPDVNWLTFANEADAALQRWNTHLHALSIQQRSKRCIQASYTILSQTAWDYIAQHSFDTIEQVWAKLFEKQQLYTCISPNVQALTCNKISLENGFISRIAEKLMLNNISYLRAYYKSKQTLAHVIRWDPSTKSYYLSDY